MKKRGKWRLIFSRPSFGPGNMAIDEALFLLSGSSGFDGTLRFYFWKPACISLGYFQRPEDALDAALCKASGIGITRRITGGGAIYHHAEITYSITANLPNAVIPSNVDASYRSLEEFIIKSLNMLGAKVSYRGKAEPENKNFYCFARPSKYDVVCGGKKIAGSAQRRSGRLFLQHGSILLNLKELDKMFAVLKPDCDIFPAKKAFEEKVTALDAAPGQIPDKDEICKKLARSFENTCRVELREGTLTQKEKALAKSLIGKYTIL